MRVSGGAFFLIQQCITKSSTESGYAALISCMNEVIKIWNILTSLDIEVELPANIFVCNTGANHLSHEYSTVP
jgi:hypothetical protein